MKKPINLNACGALLAAFFLCPVYLSSGQIVVPPSITITNSTNTTTTTIGAGTLTVTGTNAVVSNSGSIDIGNSSDNGLLVISNGARFFDVDAEISFQTKDTNNGVIVIGSNSLWSNSGIIRLGKQGEGFMTVADGAGVYASQIILADDPQSDDSIINIGRPGMNDLGGFIRTSLIILGNNGAPGNPSTGNMAFWQRDTFILTNIITSEGLSRGNIFQYGSGTSILSGSNSYLGSTIVTNGTLLVNGTHVGGADYIITNRGTLGGVGSIVVTNGSAVEVYSNSAIQPGDRTSVGTSTGTLTVNSLTFNPGSFLNIYLGSTNSSLLNITGTNAISLSGVNVSFTNQTTLTAESYLFLTNNGSITPFFSSTNNLPSDYFMVYATNTVRLSKLINFGSITNTFGSGTNAIITGGKTNFSVVVTATDGAGTLVYSGTNVPPNTTNGFGSSTLTMGQTKTNDGLTFIGTNVGSNQLGTYLLTGTATAVANSVTTNKTYTTTNTVSVDVYDHALAQFGTTNFTLPNAHQDYTTLTSNLVGLTNADGFRVALKSSNGAIGNTNLTLTTASSLAPGASTNLYVTLAPGQTSGAFSSIVGITFSDDSILNGALTNLGTTNVLISGAIYNYAQGALVTNTNTVGNLTTATTVDLGNRHQNASFTTNLVVSNSAVGAVGYVETLSGSFTNPNQLIASGAFTGLSFGSNNTISLTLTNTNSGLQSGSVGVVFASQEVGASGLGTTTLGTNTVTLNAAIYNFAQGALVTNTNTVDNLTTATTVNLGNRHQNASFTTNLVVSNSAVGAVGYVETLSGSFTNPNQLIASGAFSGLAFGTNNTISLTLTNTNSGLQSGSVGLAFASQEVGASGLGTTTLGTNTVTLNAAIYNFAQGALVTNTNTVDNLTTATTVNLGNRHQNASFTTNLVVSNSAVGAVGYVETLSGSFTNPNQLIASGAFTGLASGSNNTISLTLTNTNSGLQSGSVGLAFASQEVGASGLGTTTLGTNTVTLNAAIYNFAQAAIASTNIDLGRVHSGGVFGSSNLTVGNTAVADPPYTETLGAVFTNATSGAQGSGSITGLVAGSSSSALAVTLTNTTTAGATSGTIGIAFTSQEVNSSGLGTTTLGTTNVKVIGMVYSGQSYWNTNASGIWSLADYANWDFLGGTPGLDGALSINDTATFDTRGLVSGSGTVTLNTNASLMAVTFSNSAASYTIGGSGTLTLQAGSNPASISNLAGSHTITSAVNLASTVTLSNVASTLTLGGPVIGTNGLTQYGTGTTVLSGNNTYTGPTTLNSGTMFLNGTNSGSGAFTVNSGATLVGTGSASNSPLTNNGGTITPGNGTSPGGTLTMGSLKINSGTLNIFLGGASNNVLDLTGSASLGGLVNFTTSSPLTALTYTFLTSTNLNGITFASASNIPANYGLFYTDTSAFLRLTNSQLLVSTDFGAGTNAIVTGGITNFSVVVNNGGLADITYSGTNGINTTGGFGTNSLAAGATATNAGLFFNGTDVGTNRQGYYTITVTGVSTNSSNPVGVDVYAHASGSLSTNTVALSNVIVGYTTAVTTNIGISNAPTNSADSIRVALYTTNTSNGALSLTGVTNVLPGTSSNALLSFATNQGVGSSTTTLNVVYGDSTNLSGALPNVGTNTLTVTQTVYDHAQGSIGSTNLILSNWITGYTGTSSSTNSLTLTNGAGTYIVNLFASNNASAPLSVTNVSSLAQGSSTTIGATLNASNVTTVGTYSSNVAVTFGDASTLEGALTNLGTTNLNVFATVFDHAKGSIGSTNLILSNWITGYTGTSFSTNSLTLTNGAGTYIVNLFASNNASAPLSVTNVSSLAQGSSTTIGASLAATTVTNVGSYSSNVAVTFGDASTLAGALTNLGTTNLNVSATVFDHATNQLSGTNLAFKNTHIGYTNPLVTTSSIHVTNGTAGEGRVALKSSNSVPVPSNTNLSLNTIAQLSNGSSTNITGTLSTGKEGGKFTNTVTVQFADDSTLGGAKVIGSTDILVVGYIYTGQSTWITNGSGNWTSFDNWDVPGGTPGLDGALSINDTATFAAAGSGTVTLNTNASLMAVTFSNSAASYSIGGSGTLTLLSGSNPATISNLAGSHTITAPVNLASTVTLSNVASTLTLGGPVIGTNGFTQYGTGTTVLSGNNTYTGPTTLNSGTMFLNGTNSGSGAFTVNSGATLAGTGRATNSSLTNNGGTITPGNGTTQGTLSMGSLTINSGTLNIFLGGSGPGSTSILAITGDASLGGTINFITNAVLTSSTYTFLTTTGGNVTNTFTFTNNLPANYGVVYGPTSVYLQLTNALGPIQTTFNGGTNAIITGGSTNFGVLLTNTGTVDIHYFGTNGSNTTGGFGPYLPLPAGTFTNQSGLAFNGTNVGSNQPGSFTVVATNGKISVDTGEVLVDVYDHALGSIAPTNVALSNVIVGYSSPVVNNLGISNASGFRVDLKTTNSTSSTNLTLENVSGLSAGSLSNAALTMAIGQGFGSFTNSVTVTYADDSTLNGALSNLGSQTLTVTQTVYDHAQGSIGSTNLILSNWITGYTGTSSSTNILTLTNGAGTYIVNLFASNNASAPLSVTNVNSLAQGSSTTIGASLAATTVTNVGSYSSNVAVTFGDASNLDGALTNLGTTNLNVSATVFDHAKGSIGSTNLILSNWITGYTGTSSSTNSLTLTNGAGTYIVNLFASNNASAPLSVTNVSSLAQGSSTTIGATLNASNVTTVGTYSSNVAVTFGDASSLAGASTNLGTTNLNVSATVFDHATNQLSGTNLEFQRVHVGYTSNLTTTTSLGITNGSAGDLRVALKASNNSTNPNLSLDTVSNLAPGASTNLFGRLLTGQGVGVFTNLVAMTFADDSTLSGASTNLGTQNIQISGYVYSGQSTWITNGGGNWTSFANWDVPGGTPGLDGALSINDTATFNTNGSGSVTLNTNASLMAVTFSNSAASYTIGGSGTLTLLSGSNPASISNLAGSHTINAPVNLASTVTLNDSAATLLTLNGSVSGTGGLVQAGAGTVILAASNSYSGGNEIQAGTLGISNSSAMGTGTVTFSGNSTLLVLDDPLVTNTIVINTNVNGTIDVGTGNSMTGSGLIEGSGTLSKNGGGTLTLTASNNYAGGTILNEGTIAITNTVRALGTGVVTFASNSTIAILGSLNLDNIYVVASNAIGTFDTRGFNVINSGVFSGDGAVQKKGAGTLTLLGTNTYTGGTILDEGSIAIGNSAGLGTGIVTVRTNATVAALTNLNIANNFVITNGVTTTFDVGVHTVTNTGVFSGFGNTIKQGTGTLVFAPTSVSTNLNGNLIVPIGTVVVNGAISAQTIVTNNGVLSGSGTVTSTVVVRDRGTISPGISPGLMTYSNLIWSGGGNYNWQVYNSDGPAGATNGYDTILVTPGGLDLSGLSSSNRHNINLWSLDSPTGTNGLATNFNPNVSTNWTILTAAGGITNFDSNYFNINTFATNGTAGFANPYVGLGTFSIGTNGNFLELIYTTLFSQCLVVGYPTTISTTTNYPCVDFQTNSTLIIPAGGNLTITTDPVVVNNNSTVILDGIFTASNSITVNPGSTFNGAGVVTTPNFLNQGTFNIGTPGNPTGTQTINGNFTQASSGTMGLNLFGPNSFGHLLINGAASLAGNLQVGFGGGYVPEFGSKYQFLTASGGISGTYGSILMPEGYRGRFLVSDNNTLGTLLIAPASYTHCAVTQNQINVAKALDTFIPATSGDRMTVSMALDQLSCEQYPAAFDAISPQFYQSLSTIAFNMANAQYNDLVEQMFGLRVAGTGFSTKGFDAVVLEGQGDGKSVKDPSKDILRQAPDNRWGMFVDMNGIFAQANSGNMLPDYNAQSGGVVAGLTYKWSPAFLTGIYTGYQGTYARYSGYNSGSSLIDNAVRFGLLATYGDPSGMGFYGDALIGGSYHNYSVVRTISFPGLNRTANSTPGAGELDSMLAAGYNWRKGNWAFGPVASLQYTYFGVNSFNETGAQSLNYQGLNWNTASMISSLGANCAYSWQANRDLMVVPQINLAWQHEFMQNSYNITGNLSGAQVVNTSSAPNRDSLYTGIGVTMEYRKKWHTGIFYNAAVGNNNLVSQNFFWSLGVKF